MLLTPSKTPSEIMLVHQTLAYGKGDIAEPLHQIINGQKWKDIGAESFAQLIYEGWRHRRSYLEEWCGDSPSLVLKIIEAAPDDEIRPFELRLKTRVPLKKNGGDRKSDQIDNVKLKDTKGGNNAEYTARRLKRDNPELLEQVEAGELSLNQAAVKAGFRQATQTLPKDPSELGKAIRRKYSDTERDLIVAAITDA